MSVPSTNLIKTYTRSDLIVTTCTFFCDWHFTWGTGMSRGLGNVISFPSSKGVKVTGVVETLRGKQALELLAEHGDCICTAIHSAPNACSCHTSIRWRKLVQHTKVGIAPLFPTTFHMNKIYFLAWWNHNIIVQYLLKKYGNIKEVLPVGYMLQMLQDLKCIGSTTFWMSIAKSAGMEGVQGSSIKITFLRIRSEETGRTKRISK